MITARLVENTTKNPAKVILVLLSTSNVHGMVWQIIMWHVHVFSDCVLTCKGEHIELVQHAKYLGIFIDEHLHFHHQVKYVVDSALREVGTFKHSRRNLTTGARRTFYMSVCHATLDYESNAYVHCLSNNLHNRLVIVSHLCVKKFSVLLEALLCT